MCASIVYRCMCMYVCVCVFVCCYQAPRAGSAIPQWWVLGLDSSGLQRLYAARPTGAGRGRSGRKKCDRWTWWKVYGWIIHNGSLERSRRRWITVEKGGQWRYMWWVLLPSDASSSLGTHHTTETPAAADSWAEQRTRSKGGTRKEILTQNERASCLWIPFRKLWKNQNKGH